MLWPPGLRRLAAIFAADVVGYSRLMGADEIGTIKSLKSHRRELVDSGISEHHGRGLSGHSRSNIWPCPRVAGLLFDKQRVVGYARRT